MENKYDKKYNDFINAKAVEALKDEFREKPFFATWKTTYYTTIAFRLLLQSISVLTFVCAVAYFVWLFSGSATLGIVLGVSLASILEYNKNVAYQNAFRSKLLFGTLGKASLIFIVLTSSISISLSYLGAPKFVEVATPKPVLNDIDQHKKQASIEADSITNFYESHIEKAEKSIEDIHSKNSWKGKTTKAARPVIIALEKGNIRHNDSLHNALSMHNVRVQVQENKLVTENEKTLQDHKVFLKTFGVYAALVTLVIEVLILLSVFWCIYYKFRSYKELGDITDKEPIKAKEVPREPKQTAPDVAPPPKKEEKKTKDLRKCLHCKNHFTPKRSDQLYCQDRVDKKGRECKRAAFYERRKNKENKK